MTVEILSSSECRGEQATHVHEIVSQIAARQHKIAPLCNKQMECSNPAVAAANAALQYPQVLPHMNQHPSSSTATAHRVNCGEVQAHAGTGHAAQIAHPIHQTGLPAGPSNLSQQKMHTTTTVTTTVHETMHAQVPFSPSHTQPHTNAQNLPQQSHVAASDAHHMQVMQQQHHHHHHAWGEPTHQPVGQPTPPHAMSVAPRMHPQQHTQFVTTHQMQHPPSLQNMQQVGPPPATMQYMSPVQQPRQTPSNVAPVQQFSRAQNQHQGAVMVPSPASASMPTASTSPAAHNSMPANMNGPHALAKFFLNGLGNLNPWGVFRRSRS